MSGSAGFLRMLPMLICMGGIFALSHQPGDAFSGTLFFGADKVVHFLVYAALAVTILRSIPVEIRVRKPGLAAVSALLLSILYGISDEYHQSFIPGRSSTFGDIAADSLGAAVVCAAWMFRTSAQWRH